ncbi:nickel-binding protein [Marinoscillum sp. MHG1-6]|uniref:nickel-binding protein n=1 Tax=Marinoscillum sp. MHG1-6 TaxID=2959627 RepID=UPI00215821E3|nr:nickel-binding protein [Marinoscillum sp. MHG1-6]
MPLFMDLHIGQDLTAEDVARAHQMDLEVQDQLQCHCLTYWFDEARSNAYCLIEAPNKETAVEVHNRSHKQMPDEIIEVDKRVVKAFLGRILDPVVADFVIDQKIKVFSDSAFRVILSITISQKKLLIHQQGERKAENLTSTIKGLILEVITKHKGVAADSSSNEIITTFESAQPAYECSREIMALKASRDKDLNLRMVIHAGNPVDQDPDIFGATLKQSRFLCSEHMGSQLNVTYTVADLLQKSGVSLDRTDTRSLAKSEEELLKKLVKVLHANWQNAEFDVSALGKELLISKSQLFRKCVSLTGESPNIILRNFRLGQAIQKLNLANRSVSQIAFSCGFNNPSYFTKCFHSRFGLKPSEYMAVSTAV